jgi:hypothetical protein
MTKPMPAAQQAKNKTRNARHRHRCHRASHTACVGGAASLGGGAAVQRIREKGECASRRDARDGRGSGRCKGRARRAGGEPGEPGEPVEPVEPVEPGEPGERGASAGRFPFQSHAPT